MVRLVKKPTKRILTLCRKYRVKATVKKGSKRVYKSKRTLMKQIRRKMRSRKSIKKTRKTRRKTRKTRRTRRSRFGSTTWWNPALFGKSYSSSVVSSSGPVSGPVSAFGKRRKTRFGKDCGCGGGSKHMTMFGRRRHVSSRSVNIRKLRKLCKFYKIKIGKKKPETLRKQCLKKALKMLRASKKKKSRKSRKSRRRM